MMYVCMAGAQMYEGVVFYLVARMREIRAHEVLRDAPCYAYTLRYYTYYVEIGNSRTQACSISFKVFR